jgi:hypothetical protein
VGKIHQHFPVKLIIGFISADEKWFARVEKSLISRFGAIDFQSEILPFDYTDYYAKEMGKDLKRKFIGFKRLIPCQRLPAIKLFTNQLEQRFSKGGKRMINIDPGYLTEAKLVLASTKDFCHRIYLGEGIFAEITLTYTKNSFRPFEWTYPDYGSREYINIFHHLRKIYSQQIRGK